MAKFSLRRYDTQARMSVAVAIVSLVSLAATCGLIFRHVDFSQFLIIYGNNTRKLLIYSGGALTLLLAGIAFGFGINSAGQRRNDKQQLSWLGFFISAGVLTMTLIVLYTFHSRGQFVG